MQVFESFNDLLSDRQDRTDHPFENLVALDQVTHALIQPSRVHLADLQAERLEDAAQMVVKRDARPDQHLAAA